MKHKYVGPRSALWDGKDSGRSVVAVTNVREDAIVSDDRSVLKIKMAASSGREGDSFYPWFTLVNGFDLKKKKKVKTSGFVVTCKGYYY